MTTLPGTLWLNRGRWNWKVRLPGDDRRRNYPLRAPGHKVALAENKGRDMAESIAWRMLEKASRKDAGHSSAGLSLDEACSRFLAWASTYYRHVDGSPTRETYNCEIALRSLRSKCGRQQIDDITYTAILDVRDELVASGLNRSTVNQRVGIWKRFFAWALENRICTAQTKSEVWAVGSLKRNRSEAGEGTPVAPVAHRDVKAVLPYLPPLLRSMVLVNE